jgi:hypothetical protein
MKRKSREKRIDARDMNWPPAPSKSKRKKKDVMEQWFEAITVRPAKGEPI